MHKIDFYNRICIMKILPGQMSSFKVLFFGWLFASQKTGFSGFRYRFMPSRRFGTGYASPYNPCHCLKIKKLEIEPTSQKGLSKPLPPA